LAHGACVGLDRSTLAALTADSGKTAPSRRRLVFRARPGPGTILVPRGIEMRARGTTPELVLSGLCEAPGVLSSQVERIV
jgi:hypothetical protein